MTLRSRYLSALDEEALFRDGAAGWRLDVGTMMVLRQALTQVEWLSLAEAGLDPDAPAEGPDNAQARAGVARPVGRIPEAAATTMQAAVREVLRDPVLLPGVSRVFELEPCGIEVFNAAADVNWHHDGLSRRRGHAGEFFFIAYFGEATWDPAWGGAFEYGARPLSGDGWMHAIAAPKTVHRIYPAERTALLGWNQNPRLVHRAAPLLAPRNRITLIMPLAARMRGAGEEGVRC